MWISWDTNCSTVSRTRQVIWDLGHPCYRDELTSTTRGSSLIYSVKPCVNIFAFVSIGQTNMSVKRNKVATRVEGKGDLWKPRPHSPLSFTIHLNQHGLRCRTRFPNILQRLHLRANYSNIMYRCRPVMWTADSRALCHNDWIRIWDTA